LEYSRNIRARGAAVIGDMEGAVAFARDGRYDHIAHRRLNRSKVLEGSRKRVHDARASVGAVLNVVEQ
jgi:hypothetical protein